MARHPPALVRQGYAVKHESTHDGKTDVKVSIAVPLFREWILDTQGTG